MRTCAKCAVEYPLETGFAWSSQAKGVRHTRCRVCSNKAAKENYEANKERYKDNASQWRKTQKSKHWDRYLESKAGPCMDCGNSYHPYVMDFDHRDPSEKVDKLSQLMRRKSRWEDIQSEIDKCDLVCSNCHRMRTFHQLSERYGSMYYQTED